MSHETLNDLSGAIAVIGLAGRFPQAQDLDVFWQNLMDKKEVVTFFSEEELLEAGVAPELVHNPNYVPAHAVIEGVEDFDAAFFGYSPREAQMIDPQQRLFLECAWQAMENAGYDVDRCEGAVGVFGGQSMNQYLFNIMANPDKVQAFGWYQIILGNDKDFLTTRVSYKLNLRGPSMNMQTACSTSLVAVHVACQNLQNYQCDMALAGGVSARAERKSGYLYQPGMIMSPDGHCRAFDRDAHGIVGGEGVGMVVLKRYADAVRDRDTIHAVIRGSAINNDGGMKVSFTAPSVNGQAEAILMAQAVAGIDPRSITCIEAHGTGTELGDPIEISALMQAFRTGTQEKGYCAIGSVKTHMGHLDAAAGIASFIKAVLALEHKTLPPSFNFESPNPNIDFANSPFYVNTEPRPWNTDRLPRRAGVSAFGNGGTNAHVIVEEAPTHGPEKALHSEQMLIFSARSLPALKKAGQNLVEWLRKHPTTSLENAAYTLQVGRSAFKHRAMLVCRSVEEAVEMLEDPQLKRVTYAQQDAAEVPVVFLFPDVGSQYVGMGLGLYESEPVFRQALDECAAILNPLLGFDLRNALYPASEHEDELTQGMQTGSIARPALFAVEYALARLLNHSGVQPRVMLGMGVGEAVADCLSGKRTLEEALTQVADRVQTAQAGESGQPGADFWKSFKTLASGPAVFLKVGPGSAQTELLERHSDMPIDREVIPSMRSASETAADNEWLTQAVGKLWLGGASLDWEAYHQGETLYRIPLPTYPFERKRFWLERPKSASAGAAGADVYSQSFTLDPGLDPSFTAGNGNGKAQVSHSARPQRDEIEKKLIEIWQDVIGSETIGVNDNFFDLGGHSLMAMQILSRVRNYFGMELPLREFLEASTVAELSRRVEAMLWVETDTTAGDTSSDDREEITL